MFGGDHRHSGRVAGWAEKYELEIAITGEGTNWVNGASVLTVSGTGITVNSTTVVSATSATASLTIAAGAPTGPRDVIVTTGGGSETLGNGFGVVDPPIARPPTGLYASSIAGNLVTLRWTSPVAGLTPTQFVIEGGLVPGQVLASLPTGTTAPMLTLPAPNGAWFVRVHTVSGTSRSPASNEIRIFVNHPTVPSAPDNLLARVSGNALALAWRTTFGGGPTESMILDVSGAASTAVSLPPGEFASFANVPNGTYTLRIRAANGSGISSPSNAVVVTIPGSCEGLPHAPIAFIAYRIDRTVHVSWEPPTAGSAPASYQLIVTGALTLTVPTTQRALSGQVPSGTYHLSVRTVNSCGTGTATPVTTFTIP